MNESSTMLNSFFLGTSQYMSPEIEQLNETKKMHKGMQAQAAELSRVHDSIEEGNSLHREGNDLSRDGNDLSRESNALSRDSNDLSREGNTLSRDGNDLSKEGNALSRDGNDLSREGNTLTKEGNSLQRESNYRLEEGFEGMAMALETGFTAVVKGLAHLDERLGQRLEQSFSRLGNQLDEQHQGLPT